MEQDSRNNTAPGAGGAPQPDFDPAELQRQLAGLGKTVAKTVGEGLSETVRQLNAALEQTARANQAKQPPHAPAAYSHYRYGYTRTTRRSAGGRTAAVSAQYGPPHSALRRRIRSRRVLSIFGIVALSYLAVSTGVAALVALAVAEISILIPSAAVTAGLGFGIRSLSAHSKNLKLVASALDHLGSVQVCVLSELAATMNVQVTRLRKAFSAVIKAGLLPGFSMSKGNKLLFTSYSARQAYEDEAARQQQKAADRPAPASAKPAKKAAPAKKAEESENEAFLRQLNELNAKIEDKAVHEQVEHIRQTAEKIFEQVRQHPKQEASIRKFTHYYLPTTIKLLTTYTRVDDEEACGDNIESIRTDIPGILSTLDKAYVNLLDSLYADVALDVSADVSVLRSMLAQEGLVEDGDILT